MKSSLCTSHPFLMFSCRFCGRGSSIPFLYTVDFFLLFQKCWFRYSSTNIGKLPILPSKVQWMRAHCSYFYSPRNHQFLALCYRAFHLRLACSGTFLRRTSLLSFSRKRVFQESQNQSCVSSRSSQLSELLLSESESTVSSSFSRAVK